MYNIALLSGSPALTSKSQHILRYVERRLQESGFQSSWNSIRDFDPAALLYGQVKDQKIVGFINDIAQADALVVATPIYKGALTGALKALLDILPQYALREKIVLPIATGGSIAHLLAMDYSIKPVLSILGSSAILPGIFITDQQYRLADDGHNFELDLDVQIRLDDAIENLVRRTKDSELLKVEQ